MVDLSLWKVVCCRDFCYSNGWQPCHYGCYSVIEISITQWMLALSLWKVFCCRDFCYYNGWQACIIESSLLSIFLLFQWMIAFSLWKVVYCRDFCYSKKWQPFNYGRQSVFEILVTPMDGSLDIMEGSLLSRFLLFLWMVALTLWKVVYCRDFCYSNK